MRYPLFPIQVPCQDMGVPPTGTAWRVLAMWQAACLLRSRRKTFLLTYCFERVRIKNVLFVSCPLTSLGCAKCKNLKICCFFSNENESDEIINPSRAKELCFLFLKIACSDGNAGKLTSLKISLVVCLLAIWLLKNNTHGHGIHVSQSNDIISFIFIYIISSFLALGSLNLISKGSDL